MISKYKYEKIVNKYLEPLKKALHINTTVNIHIYNSQSKKYTKLFPRAPQDDYGFASINSEGDADVFLFYDMQSSEREALSTLIHELLHVRMYKFSSLVTINEELMYRREERFVRDLEVLIINLLWDKKL